MRRRIRDLLERVDTLWRRLVSSPLDEAIRQGMQVGEGTRISASSFGTEPWLIEIGDDCTISTGVRLLTHDAALSLAVDDAGRRYSYGRIRVGNRCFIGAGAILLPGVALGDEVVVAAGAVVTASVPSGVVVAGVPARPVARTSERIDRWLAEAQSDADRGNRSLRDFSTSDADRNGLRDELLLPSDLGVPGGR